MAFQFINYMRNIAELLKEIQHSPTKIRFYRMSGIDSLEEVLSNLLTAGVPALGVIDNLDGKLTENNADKIDDRQFYKFFVFGRTELFNHDHRELEKIKLKMIALKIISKLKHNQLSDFDLNTTFGLRHLDINSISYMTINALPEGFIALAVSFVIDEGISLKLNPSDWLTNVQQPE